MATKEPDILIMRSQLGRARGLGAAHGGTRTWWAERATSIALVPLTLWFVFSIFHLAGMPRVSVAEWAAGPLNATLLLALVLTTFYHMQLGLRVIIEDYIHVERRRMVALLVMKGAVALLALAAVLSVLKLAFAG